MTLSLFEIWRRIPSAKKSSLPPAQITKAAADTVELAPSRPLSNATMISHFGLGIGGALVFAFSKRMWKSDNPWTSGALFGMGVWSVSYLGWIPCSD